MPERTAGNLAQDFELLGERLEMDFLALLQNRLNLAVTPKLTDLLRNRPNNAKDLANKWDTLIGGKTADEATLVKALLALAFGLLSWDFGEAVLRFCCERNFQNQLNERGLWQIWLQTLRDWFGWSDTETPDDETALRKKVCSALLLSELVKFAPSVADRFPFLPPEPNRQIACELVRRWRDSTNWQLAYCEAANEIERQHELSKILVISEDLLNAETFRAIDELLVREVRNAVHFDGSNFSDKVDRLSQVAQKRKGSFWSRQDETIGNFWEAVDLAANLWQRCKEAIGVSERLQGVNEFIKHYNRSDGWWQLDFWALQLAAKQIALIDEDKRKFVMPAWAMYRRFLDSVNSAFANAVEKEGWQPTQFNFWQETRHGRERRIVFIVDALRFDLAMYLREKVGNAVNFEVRPLTSVLPSITEIGMASLLPNANEGLEVTWEVGKLVVRLKGEDVSNRSRRKSWIERFLGESGKVVELDEIQRVDIGNVSLLVVLSREVDEFGTFAADLHPQGLLEMVNRIAQAVRFAAEKGFSRILIVSDHGFLFAPPDCEPNFVQSPSKSLIAKRRFVIGGKSEGCWTVSASGVGLKGDLLFAFPKGFAVFALRGEREVFLHGGLSLQESIVPMLVGQVTTPVVKIAVRLHVQEPISSRIAKVTVEAQSDNPFAQPRKVKAQIGSHESDICEVSTQQTKAELSIVWLDEFDEPPSSVVIQLLDAETGQVLDEKHAEVSILV